MLENNKPKAISLYSGCGGADLGLINAGFDIIWSNDIDPDCCETYTKNIGTIMCGDIRNIPAPKDLKADLLIAGFPCQPFSNAGKRLGLNDTRGNLYEETFRFIEESNPEIVIYENVRGFLSFKDENGVKLIDKIADQLRIKYGYHVNYYLLNMSHFGVPQNRVRVVLIATKKETNGNELLPSLVVNKDISIKTTLQGLNKASANQTEIMKLNPQALHYGAMIPEGGSWKNIPYDKLPLRWKKIRDNMPKYHYPNFFKRYSRNDVSGTITAAFKPENAAVWHPIEDRIFSVREIARIQTFPDNFIFYGKNIKSKYQQIGNAIPPLFMERLGKNLIKHLKNEKIIDEGNLEFHKKININKPLI